MADAHASGACGAIREGSSPFLGTYMVHLLEGFENQTPCVLPETTVEEILALIEGLTKGATTATGKINKLLPVARPGEELVLYDDEDMWLRR